MSRVIARGDVWQVAWSLVTVHAGRIPLIVVGADSASGVQSARTANHYSLLRTIEDAWGPTPLGKAAAALPMTDYAR
jgi:hypothetical protein